VTFEEAVERVDPAALLRRLGHHHGLPEAAEAQPQAQKLCVVQQQYSYCNLQRNREREDKAEHVKTTEYRSYTVEECYVAHFRDRAHNIREGCRCATVWQSERIECRTIRENTPVFDNAERVPVDICEDPFLHETTYERVYND
jgi:hypothetical protein